MEHYISGSETPLAPAGTSTLPDIWIAQHQFDCLEYVFLAIPRLVSADFSGV